MKRLLVSPLAFGALTTAALAGPVELTEAQMDRVTAGAVDVINNPGFFRLKATEDGATVSVLMRGHEGRVDYEVIEVASGSLHVVVHTAGTPTSVEVTGLVAVVAGE